MFLAEGQTSKAWDPSKSNALSEIRDQWVESNSIFLCPLES
jgi:hypothetical protein